MLTFLTVWEVESVGLSQGNDRFVMGLKVENDEGGKWLESWVLTPSPVLPFEPELHNFP